MHLVGIFLDRAGEERMAGRSQGTFGDVRSRPPCDD
jgi:hypothetical protein